MVAVPSLSRLLLMVGSEIEIVHCRMEAFMDFIGKYKSSGVEIACGIGEGDVDVIGGGCETCGGDSFFKVSMAGGNAVRHTKQMRTTSRSSFRRTRCSFHLAPDQRCRDREEEENER